MDTIKSQLQLWEYQSIQNAIVLGVIDNHTQDKCSISNFGVIISSANMICLFQMLEHV